MDVPPASSPWQHFLTRPFDLFGTSTWQAWYSSELWEKMFSCQTAEGLFIEEQPGLVRHYRCEADLRQVEQATTTLLQTQPETVQQWLQEGIALNEQAAAGTSQDALLFPDVTAALNFYIEIALKAVILPHRVGVVLSTEQLEASPLYPMIRVLRSQSYYDAVLTKIVVPLTEQTLIAAGEAKEALPLITVQEVLAHAWLGWQNRRQAREEGKLFVYHGWKGGESVQWVSETRSLIEQLEGESSEGGLTGTPAYRGRAVGRVRIIITTADMAAKEFQEGDILVTITSNPAFLPLMEKCGAIVADEGGITSHAAIISRELRKPCVIATKRAIKVLRDGDVVEVDAEQGRIRLIERV